MCTAALFDGLTAFRAVAGIGQAVECVSAAFTKQVGIGGDEMRAAGLTPESTIVYPGDLVVEEDKAAVSDAVRRFSAGRGSASDLSVRLKARPDEQDGQLRQASTVASSMSITGMSSLIG